VYFDSAKVSVTKSPGDEFWISGRPDSLADWICDDKLYIEQQDAGLGFSRIIDGGLPECRPVEEVLAPVSARLVTDFLPEGSNCVTFRLADTHRAVMGSTEIYLVKRSTAGVGGGRPAPRTLALHTPRPNPLTSESTIGFELPVRGEVRVVVFDPQGRRVRVLANGEEFGPGTWSVSWDGRDKHGSLVPAGIYLLRLTEGGNSLSRRFVVAR
jgi:hypothetical protein